MPATEPFYDDCIAPGSGRYDWDLAAAMLARGSGVGNAARVVGCHRTTVWRALRRSEAFRRRIAGLRAEYLAEAAAPLERLREEVVAGIRREVALGNVRVLLWLADRLGLAAPDPLGLAALHASPHAAPHAAPHSTPHAAPYAAPDIGHAAAGADRAARADGRAGDDPPPPDLGDAPLRYGPWPEPAATPAEALPPGEDPADDAADAASPAEPPAPPDALPAGGPVDRAPPAGVGDPYPAPQLAAPPGNGTPPEAPPEQPAAALARALAEVRAVLATERPALRARAAAQRGLPDATPAGPVADVAPRRNGQPCQPLAAQRPGRAGVAPQEGSMR